MSKNKCRVNTLGHLYEQGKISSGVGARLLECDRYKFYRLLSEQGFSIIDYTEAELNIESQTSREVAERINKK
ncbi:MAG: UPF0175 family protein [Anaerolineales bacterium]|nr:UPF0175 family protein [Anaerolineales bacterium]